MKRESYLIIGCATLLVLVCLGLIFASIFNADLNGYAILGFCGFSVLVLLILGAALVELEDL
jgi:nucleoside recognition membrane protein YjiH